MDNSSTFHVLSDINMSLASAEELEQIYAVLKTFNITFTQITTGQRLAVYGLKETEFTALRHELFKIIPRSPVISVNYIHTCPSLKKCKYATRDSQDLGRRLEQLSFPTPLPNKVKIGIAGCKMCCTTPYVRDIGIIGSRKGWTLVFGGNAGGKPRIADIIAEKLHDDQVVELVQKCIDLYRQEAFPKDRTARFIEHFGIEKFRNILLQ